MWLATIAKFNVRHKIPAPLTHKIARFIVRLFNCSRAVELHPPPSSFLVRWSSYDEVEFLSRRRSCVRAGDTCACPGRAGGAASAESADDEERSELDIRSRLPPRKVELRLGRSRHPDQLRREDDRFVHDQAHRGLLLRGNGRRKGSRWAVHRKGTH